ncbi:hypothetical protein, partial [Vibrio crassostreae]
YHMPMLPALFMSVPLFARSHGMSERQVLDRLDNADLPEVEKELDAGKRYVDLVELAARMEAGQFKLSILRKKS